VLSSFQCERLCELVLQLKTLRKSVAELLKSEKQEYARIRVEGIIRENLMLQVGAAWQPISYTEGKFVMIFATHVVPRPMF
jgi:hypothetical protein